jgi:hypothetical protein
MKKLNIFLLYLILNPHFSSNLSAQYNHLWSFGAGTDFSSDFALVSTVDNQSNVYISGLHSGGIDFDPGSGEFILENNYDFDIFIAKYSSTGDLLYAKSIAGPNYEQVTSISIDGNGNLIVCGNFYESIDIDPTSSQYILEANGEPDIFIAKYDSSGNLLFGFHLGSEGGCWSKASTDEDNNIYVCGTFQNEMDADPGPGVDILTTSQFRSIFFAKFDSEGNYIFARSLEGDGEDFDLIDSETDKYGNIFLSGYFWGTLDFDPGTNVEALSSDKESTFFAKYNTVGELIFVKNLVCTEYSLIRDFYITSENDIILTGNYADTIDFDGGLSNYLLTATADANGFLARYDSLGNLKKVVPLSIISGYCAGWKLTSKDGSEIYITGSFESTIDFDPGPGEAFRTSNGASDIFLAHYDTDFNYIDAVTIGGSEWDDSYSCSITPEGDVYITGSFSLAADFDPGEEEVILSSTGYEDIFLAKYTTTPVGTFQPTAADSSHDLTIFPNPASEEVILRTGKVFQEAEVKIYNMSGLLICRMADRSGESLRLNIKDLPNGIYLIEVIENEESWRGKMVVSN